MTSDQLLIDLNLVLSDRDDAFERAGSSVIRHRSFADPQLQLLETSYPREIARARFQAIHRTVMESWNADPATIGSHFRAALIEIFGCLDRTLPPGFIRIDRKISGRGVVRPGMTPHEVSSSVI